MKSVLTLILSVLSILSFTQTPNLVVDFNVGSNDSYNEYNFDGVYLGDDIIFPIVGDNIGEELAILKQGELSVLKDINAGTDDSDPKDFVVLNNKVYFSAYDATNGGALWVSNGTTEGTQMFYDPGTHSSARPEGLIVSKSGKIYFTYNNELHYTDGTVKKKITSGIEFSEIYNAGYNFSTYKNEIAYVKPGSGYAELYQVVNDTVALLDTIAMSTYSTKMYGLTEVEKGLLFCAYHSYYDVNATYIYREPTKTIEKLIINNETPLSRRLNAYNEGQAALSWIEGKGYYSLNGEDNKEVQLIASPNTVYQSGKKINTAIFGNKMAFDAVVDFYTDSMIYTDGTTEGTKTLFELEAYNSNMIKAGKYAFFVSGTSNNFKPKFYYINLDDGTFNNFYSASTGATFDAIQLLGVQNNKLYYLSSMNADVGRELYYIDLLDITIGTKYSLTVTDGAGSGKYYPETLVSIVAQNAPVGKVFDKWTGDIANISDANNASTTLLMPNSDVAITATYTDLTKYTLVVNNGSGSGEYAAGVEVEIIADVAPDGEVFEKWIGDTLSVSNIYKDATTLVMPDSSIQLTAVYKALPSYSLTVTNGTGSGEYMVGVEVNIIADAAPEGKMFDKWTGDIDHVTDVLATNTIVTMPGANVAVVATYKDLPTYTLTVTNGAGSGNYMAGTTVDIIADDALEGKIFDKWSGDISYIQDVNAVNTTVAMPSLDIVVEATYKDLPTFTLTVANGSGSGNYLAGTTVDIIADDAPEGKVFDKWIGDTTIVADSDKINTTVTMPENDATLTATYKDVVSISEQQLNDIGNYISVDNQYNKVYIKSNQVAKITIFTLAGQKIRTFKNVSSIDFNYLPKGIYIFQIATVTNIHMNKKIIKN